VLKKGVQIIDRKGLHYIADNGNTVKRFTPWLGDLFSFLYDPVMKNSIFPRKFEADMGKHYEILGQALQTVHLQPVLELAAGTGSAVNFLSNDNQYTGTDISPGLLRRALKNFKTAGFVEPGFYITGAEDLPFDDNTFSICLCVLSLNFFDDIKGVFKEIKRVLVPGGEFVCCVPVPELNKLQHTIRGKLYSESELVGICKEHGFRFEGIPAENGALLYFKALLEYGR